MKFRTNQQGSAAHIVIIVALVLVVLGLLGFVFWQNFLKKDTVTVNEQKQNTAQSSEEKPKCDEGEDEKASNGVFCSEVYGVKFSVPEEFKGQLQQSENVAIFPIADSQPEALGESESVISAKVSRGQYDYILTISLLPQINTMSVGFAAGGQFDSSDKKLYAIISTAENPAFHRDGEYPFVTSTNGIKVYRGTYGDVGHILYQNAIIIGDKVVIIDVNDKPNVTEGLPTEAPTVDDAEILSTLTLL